MSILSFSLNAIKQGGGIVQSKSGFVNSDQTGLILHFPDMGWGQYWRLAFKTNCKQYQIVKEKKWELGTN